MQSYFGLYLFLFYEVVMDGFLGDVDNKLFMLKLKDFASRLLSKWAARVW